MIMLHWQFHIIYYNVKKPHTRRNFPGKKGGTSAPVIPGKIIIESLSIIVSTSTSPANHYMFFLKFYFITGKTI